jgi:hypothetical protein
MAATKGFTGPNTSAKSLTIAAQMMSGGAKQQDIVNTLFNQSRDEKPRIERQTSKDESVKPSTESNFSIMNPPKIESKPETKTEQKAETIADKLAKQGVELTAEGVKDAKTGEVIKDEPIVEAKSDTVEDEQSPKKFKNPSQKQK